ncbi:restriction endonuclease subunit S [Clostridium butyricum]|uniref:restriction endonuclease subunit S n=3 Tax=Clostridium butyricum TaxID=1492 RepID=UPI0034650A69
MNKNKEKVPKIRFPGFTEPWEQRKLGEVSEKVTEKNKNNIYSETLTNSAEYGIINQRDFFDKDISNEKNLDGYYIVRPDDFVYNPRISNYAPVGPINRNNLGRSGVMSPLYYVFRTHSVDKIFLEKYFSSNNWHKFMKLNGDSGARADRFAIKDSVFREMPIPSPAIEEQTKIGEFFQGIDNLITLHQRKLNHLKDKKKGLLQKMFPKNGELVPELRFPEFTAPWEQRKLGDMCDEFKSGSSILAKDICEQGEYPVYGGNGLRGYTATYNHDGIYALIGRQGALCGNMNKVYGKAYFTEHAVAVKANKNNNTDFLFFLLDKMNLRQYSGQSAQPGLAVNKLIELITLVPNCSEQKLIGIFFNKLDNLITLHQRKLDHLKEQKKALLQQMFI